MELEDFTTNLESDALAIQELVSELQEYADECTLNKIHAISVLIDHQISLLGEYPISDDSKTSNVA